MPSPAIFTSAGFVPSSFGPFAAGLSLARSDQAPAPKNPIVTTATPARKRRIAALLAPFARPDSITLSDVPAAIRFLRVSLRLCVILSLLFCDPCLSALPCIPGNASAPTSLRPSVSALHCLRGHLATPSQFPSALACTRSILSACLRYSLYHASAAISAKASRETQLESLNSRRTGKPRANRAPRNPLPFRS